jgi:hypothetical protein
VITSKYGKSHQPDGSEQPSGPQGRAGQAAGQTAKQNWENDGGPSNETAAHVQSEIAKKPSWSVLSLRDLNEAIEQSRRPDDPWRVHQEAQRLNDARASAARIDEARAEAAKRASRNFYRNPWEHT